MPGAAVRARCDVHEVRGFDHVDLVPDTARDDERIAPPQDDARLGADRLFVAVVEDHLDRSAHEIQELVAVGMELALMRRRTFEVGDHADRVAIDALRWTSRARNDRPDAAAGDLRNFPLEGLS